MAVVVFLVIAPVSSMLLLKAGAAVGAPGHLAGERIPECLVSERKIRFRVKMVLAVALGASRLRKAKVHADAAAAADPVQDAVDDAPPALVGVEAEGLEVVQVTRGLRNRKGIRVPYVVRQWIGIAVVVVARMAQERDEVAAGGEAEPGDDRVPGDEAELVDRALLEPRPQGQQPDCRAGCRGVFPAG